MAQTTDIDEFWLNHTILSIVLREKGLTATAEIILNSPGEFCRIFCQYSHHEIFTSNYIEGFNNKIKRARSLNLPHLIYSLLDTQLMVVHDEIEKHKLFDGKFMDKQSVQFSFNFSLSLLFEFMIEAGVIETDRRTYIVKLKHSVITGVESANGDYESKIAELIDLVCRSSDKHQDKIQRDSNYKYFRKPFLTSVLNAEAKVTKTRETYQCMRCDPQYIACPHIISVILGVEEIPMNEAFMKMVNNNIVDLLNKDPIDWAIAFEPYFKKVDQSFIDVFQLPRNALYRRDYELDLPKLPPISVINQRMTFFNDMLEKVNIRLIDEQIEEPDDRSYEEQISIRIREYVSKKRRREVVS